MSSIKIFRQYLATIKSEFREIETIQYAQLDKYLPTKMEWNNTDDSKWKGDIRIQWTTNKN